MPDDILHCDRFVFTEPVERGPMGWAFRASNPDDPAEYLGWLYPNPFRGNDLNRCLQVAAETV